MTFERRKLKYTATFNDDVLAESTDPEFQIEYVDIGDVDPTRGITGSTTYLFKDAPSRARRIVREGDTIISTVRTYLKAIAPILNPPPNLVVSTGFAVVRPNSQSLAAGFSKYALRESSFIGEVVSKSVGVSYPAINSTDLACIPIPVPPLPTQRAIADYLDAEGGRGTQSILTIRCRQQSGLEERVGPPRRLLQMRHLDSHPARPAALHHPTPRRCLTVRTGPTPFPN